MPDLSLLTDLFEMVAAIAALLVTLILYRETGRMRDEAREVRRDLSGLRAEMGEMRSRLDR